MPTRRSLARYFLRLGALGFGGPIALVGHMYHDLVETWGWITEEEYREGLALAQLSPGPLAAQLSSLWHYDHVVRPFCQRVSLIKYSGETVRTKNILGHSYQGPGGLCCRQVTTEAVILPDDVQKSKPVRPSHIT